MILFFDDFLGNELNQLFLLKLHRAAKAMPIEVVGEKTIRAVEDRLRNMIFKVVILDVMASASHDKTINQALAGIEVLKRCRTGAYGELNKTTPIYMRTARGEPHVRRLAFEYGCTNYFQAGSDDPELIESIAAILGINN